MLHHQLPVVFKKMKNYSFNEVLFLNKPPKTASIFLVIYSISYIPLGVQFGLTVKAVTYNSHHFQTHQTIQSVRVLEASTFAMFLQSCVQFIHLMYLCMCMLLLVHVCIHVGQVDVMPGEERGSRFSRACSTLTETPNQVREPAVCCFGHKQVHSLCSDVSQHEQRTVGENLWKILSKVWRACFKLKLHLIILHVSVLIYHHCLALISVITNDFGESVLSFIEYKMHIIQDPAVVPAKPLNNAFTFALHLDACFN